MWNHPLEYSQFMISQIKTKFPFLSRYLWPIVSLVGQVTHESFHDPHSPCQNDDWHALMQAITAVVILGCSDSVLFGRRCLVPFLTEL